MDFHTRLKEEIEFADIRYKELAEKSGVPERALYNYVASKKPSMPPADVAVKIAKALGLTVEYLVTGESSLKNPSNIENLSNTAEINNLIREYKNLSDRDKKVVGSLIHIIETI